MANKRITSFLAYAIVFVLLIIISNVREQRSTPDFSNPLITPFILPEIDPTTGKFQRFSSPMSQPAKIMKQLQSSGGVKILVPQDWEYENFDDADGFSTYPRDGALQCTVMSEEYSGTPDEFLTELDVDSLKLEMSALQNILQLPMRIEVEPLKFDAGVENKVTTVNYTMKITTSMNGVSMVSISYGKRMMQNATSFGIQCEMTPEIYNHHLKLFRKIMDSLDLQLN